MANQNKNIDVTLSFSADTKQVKTQLADLKETLKGLTTSALTSSPLGLTKELNESVKVVNNLQAVLKESTTEVGKLDLGKFRQQLEASNLTANKISKSLLVLGDEGISAFAQLTQSITMAEVPLKRTNKLLNDFAVTLKNTAKWQISSSMIHGFTGALQKAYSYAQDLNKSLNNIRIVTGKSTKEMGEFAKEANEAAKALSTTTTAYTDASLIFYQQGLDDKAVKERTNTVLKLSNVTGEAVKDVSSYMTAIWNNFADGSQPLEHYADVITALGAATASSSAEIAAGLEKFAAIGQTVGLSYDYATAALATVVAKTRQSADTVGNAFKTIFARLQSLKLGETLEDDVDLTKYTKALDAVGVEVIGVNGELKDLDTILDDLSKKWNVMTEAEKAALAQTVAGTRQYAQFISLMENWGEVQENVIVAQKSSGELQKQADIYAESWEGARKRVQAAWQDIYSKLLDDSFFIELTSNFGKIIEGISKLFDYFGGLKGILPGISTLLLSIFGKDLAKGINDAIYNMKLFSETGKKQITDMKLSFTKQLEDMGDLSSADIGTNALIDSSRALLSYQKDYVTISEKLLQNGIELSDVEKKKAQEISDQLKTYGDIYTQQAKITQSAKEEYEFKRQTLESEMRMQNTAAVNSNKAKKSATSSLEGFSTQIWDPQALQSMPESAQNSFNNLINDLETLGIKTEDVKAQFSNLINDSDILNHTQTIQALADTLEKLKQQVNDIPENKAFISNGEVTNALQCKEAYQALMPLLEAYKQKVNELGSSIDETETGRDTVKSLAEDLDKLKTSLSEFDTDLNFDSKKVFGDFGEDLNEIIRGAENYDGKELKKVIDLTIEKLEDLNKKAEETVETTRNLFESKGNREGVKALNEADKAAVKLGKDVRQAAVSHNGYNNAVKDGKDALHEFGQKGLQAGDFIVNVSRGISSLAMSINTLSSIGTIFDDKDATTGETILKLVTSLSMGIPGLVNGIKQLQGITSAATTALSTMAKQQAIVTAAKEKDLIVNQSDVGAIMKVIAAEELETATLTEENSIKVIKKALDGSQIKLTDEQLKQLLALISAQTTLNATQTAGLATQGAFTAGLHLIAGGFVKATGAALSFMAACWPLLAISAIIIGIVAAFKHMQAVRENEAKKTEGIANAHKELTDALVEERDVLEDTTSKYEDLYSQYKDGSISISEFKDQTIALMREQENQQGVALALTGQYEKLNEVLKEQKNIMNDNILESAKMDKANYKVSVISKLKSLAKDVEGNTHLDLAGTNWMGDRDEEFVAALNQYVGKDIFNGWDHMEIDPFVEKLMEDPQKMKNLLANFSDVEAAEELVGYIDELSGLLDGYTESASRVDDLNLEQIFREQNLAAIESAEDYTALVNRIQDDAKALQLTFSEDEINTWIRNACAGIDNVAKYAKAADIAKYILDEAYIFNENATEEEIDNILNDYAEKISLFNEEEQAFFTKNPYYATLVLKPNIDKDAISKEIEKNTRYLGEKSKAESALQIIKNTNKSKKGEISDDDKKSAYDLLGIAEGTLTDEELLKHLTNFYKQAVQLTNDFYEEARTEAEIAKQQTLDDYRDMQDTLNEMHRNDGKQAVTDSFFSWYDQVNTGTDTQAQIQRSQDQAALQNFLNQDIFKDGVDKVIDEYYQYIEKGATDASLSMTEHGKELVEAMQNLSFYYKDGDLKAFSEQLKAQNKNYDNTKKMVDQAAEAYEEAANRLDEIDKLTVDYNETIQQHQKQIENITKSLDDLQSAYNTIQSAQQEYDENGKYSIDTIQSLLDLSPEYLKQITFEGDQIILNTEAMLSERDAQYDLLEAQYAAMLQEQVDCIVKADKNDETRKSIILMYAEKEAIGQASGALEAFAIYATNAKKALVGFDSEAVNTIDNIIGYASQLNKILDLGRSNWDFDIDKATSKSSKSQNNFKEYIEELPDRYHDVNEAIKEVTHSLTMLDKIKDKLAGPALAKALKKENKLLTEQQKNYDKLGKKLKTEQLELQDQKRLSQFGAKFNENGQLSNYAETFQAIEDYMLDATEKYNDIMENSNLSEKAKEQAEREYQEAQRLHDNAQDWLSRTDEIAEELREAEEKYVEMQLQKIANNLQRFSEKFKIKIDVEEAKKQVTQFFREVNDDFTKVHSTSEEKLVRTQSYVEESGYSQNQFNTLGDELNQIIGILEDKDYGYGEDGSQYTSMAEGIHNAQEVFDDYMAKGKEVYSTYKDAYSEFADDLSDIGDQWDEILDGISDTLDELEHYQKLTELLYGDTEQGRQIMQDYYETSLQGQLNEQQVLTEQIDQYKIFREEFKQLFGEDSTLVKEMDDKIKDAEGKLRSSIESYLKTAQDIFLTAVEMIAQTMNKAMVNLGAAGYQTANGVSAENMELSEISERWQDAQKAADKYYDEVQRVYQLEQLEEKWNKALTNTKTTKVQQVLKNIMDSQLNNLREKTELSEYDVQLAEKELAIAKAQAELEDARNNKNSMKLVRNEQGNWAYQYVADENEVEDKEQAALDLIYEKYDFVKSANREAVNELLQLQQEAQERISAIEKEMLTADESRLKELQEKLDYLKDYYYGDNGLIVKKSRDSVNKRHDLEKGGMDLLVGLYNDNEKSYGDMTEKQKELIGGVEKQGVKSYLELQNKIATDPNGFYPTIEKEANKVIGETQTDWEELAGVIVSSWGKSKSDPGSVWNVVTTATEACQAAYDEYKNDITKSEETVKKSWSNVKTEIENVRKEISDKDKLLDQIKKITNQTPNIIAQATKVKELKDKWDLCKKAIEDAWKKLEKFIKLLTKEKTYEIHVKWDIPEPNVPKIPDQKVTVTREIVDKNTGGGGGGSTNKGYLLWNAQGGEKSGKTYKTLQEIYDILTPMSGDAQKEYHIKDLNTGKEIDNTTSAKDKADAYGKEHGWAVVYKDTHKLFNNYTDLTKDEAESLRIKHQGQRTLEVIEKDKVVKDSSGSTTTPTIKVNNTRNQNISSGATGMYTGEWGNEGKLAILHEKELVLNKEDTSNILNAVAAVREISGIGSSIANTISSGISNLVSGMLGIKPASAGYPSSTTNNNATNTFHIHAEFPNANSVAEIQEAILNLPNLASQYLSKNKM